MEKRYQVFVSSTYEDLRLERQAVMHALLELDCIPAGMELFPAADDDQWSLITTVIDDCDYYVVILAGRYGSLDPTGIGYTEKEYRYALEKKKPIAAFVHKEPGKIASDLCEQDSGGKEKLGSFRELVQKKMCKQWSTADELAGVVSRSVSHLIKHNPAVGWVRGDEVTDVVEVLQMKRRIEDLEGQLTRLANAAPIGSEDLAQGDEYFTLQFSFQGTKKNKDVVLQTLRYTAESHATWDEIFSICGPTMLDEASALTIRTTLVRELAARFSEERQSPEFLIQFAEPTGDYFNTIIVQLRALGLITKSTRPRSVKDKHTYWTLTPYGDRRLTELRAIKRDIQDYDDDDEDSIGEDEYDVEADESK